MFTKIRKNIYLSLLVLFVIYLFSLLFTDFAEIKNALLNFNSNYIPLILILMFASYFLKYLRWKYYLSKLDLDVELKSKTLFVIFNASLTMSLTPGKIGDLIKSYMIKDIENIDVAKTVPSIIAERIIETISLMFIVVLGINYFKFNRLLLLLSLLLFLILFIIILNKKYQEMIIIAIGKSRYLRKYVMSIGRIFDNLDKLFKLPIFFKMFFLSIIIWSLEGITVYIIFFGMVSNVNFIWSQVIYYSSVFIGSVSFIPAGLGIVDGSLFYFIKSNGIKTELAVSIPLLIRVFILWFPILFGAVYLSIFNKLLKKKKNL